MISIGMDFDEAFRELDTWLKKAESKVLPKAIKRTLGKKAATIRNYWGTELGRTVIKLKPAMIKKRLHIKKRLKGGIRAMHVNIGTDKTERPMSMIDFVKGQKKPRKQAGVKLKRRGTIKTEVIPGRIIKQKGAFIAKGKGSRSDGKGNFHLFRRKKKGSKEVMSKQAAPRLSHYAGNKKVMRKVQAMAGRTLTKELVSQLKLELGKLRTAA